MKKPIELSTAGRLAFRGAALSAVLLALGACNLNTQTNAPEGIGFREARFQEISAMREYRQCRDDALELDTQARTTGNAGRYVASAKLLEKCETRLGPEAASLNVEERMRAYALSVQNYIKGGDVEGATANFDRFKRAFPDKDLYYPGGASFRETMEVLLGNKEPSELGRFAGLNVNGDLKSEMRRVRYWKHQ